MGDQRQDAWVSQQFDRYPRYWGQTGNPGTTYPGPRFENNRGGYNRPRQNVLDIEDRADHSDIHSRILNTAQIHGRDTAGWRRKSRQRSWSVGSDSEEEYRRDQKRSGRSYSCSSGKFGSGSQGYQDEGRTSVARGRRDSSDSSYERDKQRSRQTSHGRPYPSRSRAFSEDSEDGFSQRRRRHRSPPLPKLPTFDGKPAEWKSFICQFRQRAKSCAWSRREKLDRLMACLRGKAVDYVFNRPKDLRADYYTLKHMLSQCYNIAELPGTARRQLNTMRQEEQESLEDYADHVLGKVSEAYPNVEEDVAQALGTESFLKGCRDRSAAYAASEHKPDTIQKDLQCVKDAAANLRVFGRPAMTTRQVTFADPERESTTDGVARLSKEQEKMMQLMTEMMSPLEKNTSRRNTSPSPDRGRNRSPSPCYNCRERGHMARECPKPRRCFNCNKTGHMAEECKEEKQGFESPSVRKSVESSEEGCEWLRTTSSVDTGAGPPVVPTEEQGLDQNAEEGRVNTDCMQEEVVEVLLEGSVTKRHRYMWSEWIGTGGGGRGSQAPVGCVKPWPECYAAGAWTWISDRKWEHEEGHKTGWRRGLISFSLRSNCKTVELEPESRAIPDD